MSKLRSKKTLAAAVAVLAVLGGGGAAIAASSGDSSESFLDAVARHLGISSQKLEDATKAAAVDQVNEALDEGRLTMQQADALKARIESGEVPPLPLFGPRFRGLFGEGMGHGDEMHHFEIRLPAAAEYLGLSVDELSDRLADGKSLADVARAEGRSVAGLEQAILDAAKSRLDEDVAAGTLTRERADAMLDRLESDVHDLVNRTFPPRLDTLRRPLLPPPAVPFWGGDA
jgi:hypothetical protein